MHKPIAHQSDFAIQHAKSSNSFHFIPMLHKHLTNGIDVWMMVNMHAKTSSSQEPDPMCKKSPFAWNGKKQILQGVSWPLIAWVLEFSVIFRYLVFFNFMVKNSSLEPIHGSWVGRTFCLWSHNKSWSLKLFENSWFKVWILDDLRLKTMLKSLPRAYFWIQTKSVSLSDWVHVSLTYFSYYLFAFSSINIATRPLA